MLRLSGKMLNVIYTSSSDLWTPDLWTKPLCGRLFRAGKNPQIGYMVDFRKQNAERVSHEDLSMT